MFQSTMNESYRREESWANARWGPSTPIIHGQALTEKREHSVPINHPKWIHSEKDLDRVRSLFLIGTAVEMRNQEVKKRSHHDLKSQKAISIQETAKSSTSSVLESHVKLQQQERWLELLPTRASSMGSMLRLKARRKSCSSSSSGELKWNERIKEVKEFVREHGHGRIPLNYPQNQDLARWSKRQRYHYKIYLKNKRKKFYGLDSSLDERCFMTQERLQDLKDAGFCFEVQVTNYKFMKRSKSCPTQRFQTPLYKKQTPISSKRESGNYSALKMSSIFAPHSQHQHQQQHRQEQLQHTPMELCLRGLQLLGEDVANPANECQQHGYDNLSARSGCCSVPKEIVLVQQDFETFTSESMQDAC